MSSRLLLLALGALVFVGLGGWAATSSHAGGPVGNVSITSGEAPLDGSAELVASFTALADFDGVGGWSFTVDYDPAVATLIECAPTIPTADDQQCGGGLGSGQFRFSGTVPEPLLGDFTFGHITFECDQDGTFVVDVEISGILNASRTVALEVTADDGMMVCGSGSPPTPTPTPTEQVAPTVTPTEPELEEPTPTATPEGVLLGDASCDGMVNAIDAALLLQLSAGLLGELPCPANGDTNGDGMFNAIDAQLILQDVAGLFDL